MLSRVADNLYWMSRYLERAEHTSRLIAVKLESLIEQTPEEAEIAWGRVVTALSGKSFASESLADGFETTYSLAFERFNQSSLISSLRFARDNGRPEREQISTEMGNRLNRLYMRLVPIDFPSSWNEQPSHLFLETVEGLHMIQVR